jgi:signal transduction histidine kinase
VPRHALTHIGALCACLCLAESAVAQIDPIKTVLVLYDGGREFTSIQLTDSGIEAALNDSLPSRVTIFREYMDRTRIAAPDYADLLREFYKAKYAGNKPDAIVAVRGGPLDFLLNDGDELFPGVPIVSAGMDMRQVQARRLPPHVGGTTLQVRYWPTIALAMALQPDLEQVAVLTGASPNDKALEALVRDELRDHEQQLTFTYLAGLPLAAALERVSHLPERAALLFVTFARDSEGRSFLPTDAVRLISSAANVPTYVNSDDVLDAGAVGGSLISFRVLGADTANLTVRVFNGEHEASIPFVESTTRVPTVDARELKRWGIPFARVPTGAVVLNRVPTPWEAYRWRIVAGIVLVLLQSAFIVTLLIQRQRRRAAEAALHVSEAQRQTAVLDERDRMARDMHDTLAQGFTGVIVQLQAAEQALAHGSAADADGHIERAAELARNSLEEARRSIRALRSQALESAPLPTALESLLIQVRADTTLEAELIVHGRDRPIAEATEDNLLRIFQEAVTNILKHARARRIAATLSFEMHALRLEVHDDGSGFDISSKHDGLGLMGIRERVHQLGGRLFIDTGRGIGTRVVVLIPYESEFPAPEQAVS